MENEPRDSPDRSLAPIPKLTRRKLLKQAAISALALGIGAGHAALSKAASASTLPPIPKDRVDLRVPRKALPFDLANVRLLDGPFKAAQERDGAYLLFLEPDRLLHNFRINAGLPPKGEIYGGWEKLGVAGHTCGHYLSACSMMYRATGDATYRQRVDYIVSELAACQKKSPTGLVCAIPDAGDIFAKIAKDGTATGWVPWYTMHKLYAGLRDSYLYCGNSQARDVMIKLTDWAIGETANLTDVQFQSMLDTEHGGMAETAADAYAMTGDEKYLALALRFTHHAVMDPLANRQDQLDGLHSNTNIPKMIGYERIYELTGRDAYHAAPLFFWQTVVGNRSYANGGNGDFEHFFPPKDFKGHIQSNAATETCCSYNMLKLSKELFQRSPDSKFADYYERTVYNHILASQEPVHGMMCYFTPMRPGQFKVYNDPVNSFWCCVGTGIENHAKYGEAIYFHSPGNQELYVNLFIPSLLSWPELGMTLRQETRFPERGESTIHFTCDRPTLLGLKVRQPSWGRGMSFKVNGKPVHAAVGSDGYETVNRTWGNGDVLSVTLPMSVRIEELPNTREKQAVMYGPLLLVGSLGKEGMEKTPDIMPDQDPYEPSPALEKATFVTASSDAARQIKQVSGEPLTFRTEGLGQPEDVTLIPMYRAHHERYNVYWSVYSPEQWEQRKAELDAEAAKQRALDLRTVDEFLPGNQQSEVDHHLQSQNSNTGYFNKNWRDASQGGWFSFTMKVDPSHPLELLCTYWGSDAGNRAFDILVDGVSIGTQVLENNRPGVFFDVAYDIPAALVAGKSSVTVELKAKPGAMAGGLFGCRLLRKE